MARRPFHTTETLRRLRLKAHENGAVHREFRAIRKGEMPVVLNSTIWNAAGNCQRPILREFQSRPDDRRGRVHTIVPGQSQLPQWADVHVRCRECEACLRANEVSWRYRAQAEYRAARRAWLLTLTFRPEEHYMHLLRIRMMLDAQGVDFESLAPDEQFRWRCRFSGHEVQKYLKRLRKAGNVFRFVAITEAHKSGLPHYHVVIFEVDKPVTHKALKAAWTAGFLDGSLVRGPAGITYVMKYLSKSKLARVRASISFGAFSPSPPQAVASGEMSEA